MQEYQSGAVRDTGGKGRMDLLPMCALLRVSKHMEDAIKPDPVTGIPHYPERNWEIGLPMHTMCDSAMRHLVKYLDGWDDEDHLCAAATNLLMALWTEEKKPEMMDIPSRMHGEAKRGPQEAQAGVSTTTASKGQGKAKEKAPVRCSCYDGDYERCKGTKEMEPCTCGGNKSKCDFYPQYHTAEELID